MRLILNLKTKELYDSDYRELYFSFEDWVYRHEGGTFILDNLKIDKTAVDDVIFDIDKEVLPFEGYYDGEDSITDLYIGEPVKYDYSEVVDALDLFLDANLYTISNLVTEKGPVEGEIEVYFDYDLEEFVIELNELILVED